MKIAKYFFITLCFSFLLISETRLTYGQKSRVSAKGIVEQIVVEDTPARYEYVLASDNGNRYRLFASHSLVEYVNRRVAVSGVLDADRLNVSNEIETVEARQSVSPPAPTFGSRKVLTLLVNFTNSPSPPVTTAQLARSNIFTNANSANGFLKEASLYRYNLTGIQRADGDVVGWLTLPFTNTPCSTSIVTTAWTQGADALARQNGYEPDNYNSVLYVFPTTCVPPIATRGSVGDTTRVQRAWFASGDMNAVKVITHEIGHNLGLDHANAFVCSGTNIPDSCQTIVYGDPFDAMGSSSFFFNNYFRLSLGWLTGKRQIITASGDYSLVAPSVTAKGNQILQIPLKDPDGQTALYSYYLEFRRPYSFDNLFGNIHFLPIYNGVSIRYAFREPLGIQTDLIDTTPNTSNKNDAPLTVGNTFTDTKNGVTITTLSTNPMRGARVRIELNQP